MKEEQEYPTRIWVHPEFKQKLSEFQEILNEEVVKETGYPLPTGMPFATKLGAEIFKEIIEKIKKNKIEILSLDEPKAYLVKINVSLKLKKLNWVKKNSVKFQ